MHRIWIFSIALTMFALPGFTATASAQVSVEQRRELNDLIKEIVKASSLIRKKDYDEAGQILGEVEKKLQALSVSGTVPNTDRTMRRATVLFIKQKKLLEKAGGSTGGKEKEEISFMEDIAPLINSRCVQCHGEKNPRNGLRLDLFSGWRKGGKGGQLLVPGNSFRSLMMARLNAPEGKGRMPQRGAPLTDDEKAVISNWIEQGAKFDGASEDKTFADLIYEEESKNVKIPRSKGTEQVKFTEDIAPWFSNLCLRCHNSRKKSGGLSVETFFDIMKGGDSGEVIIPGDMENSRLFRLVGGLELPRMPQGQARITRQNYEDLKQWFKEGNTFDGADPRASITSYVPSQAEVAMESFSSLSDAELQKIRIARSEEQFRKAMSGNPRATLKTKNFLILGNVEENRLVEVQEWADEQLKTLQETFNNDSNPWRGRLAIFVLKDQFNYSEFNEVVERRRMDPDSSSHSKVTVGQEDAYIVMQDLGDNPAKGPSLHASLIENMTAAYLNRSGKALPAWVTRGTGLVMADTAVPNRKRVEELEQTAASLAGTTRRPEDIFADGTFSRAGTEAVGYTLVKFLLANGGPNKLSQFIKELEGGANTNAALQSAYGAPAATIARSFISSLKGR